MPSVEIQWFPGHMAKTRRLIDENLSSVDIILELLDARIPYSSKNPELDRLVKTKPILMLLNKSDLADPNETSRWSESFKGRRAGVLAIECSTKDGVSRIEPELRRILADKLERDRSRGIDKPLRAMVLGIPNVGKSTLINKLCGAKKAAAENRPGVTLTKQWFKASHSLELLDMPGVLWPKFDERRVGENLAITGAIKDAILQTDEIACALLRRLKNFYPEILSSRFGITAGEYDSDASGIYDLFLEIGRKRCLLVSGGEVNEARCAAMLLEELRSGRLGRVTLERCLDK